MNRSLKKFIKKFTDIRFKERKCFVGNYSDKEVLYVIRFFKGEGLFSMLSSACGQALHARKRGLVPYVDTVNFKCQYTLSDKNINVWECFFSQPRDYELLKGNNKKKKILSSFSPPTHEDGNPFSYFNDFRGFSNKKRAYDSLFTINEEIMTHVEEIGSKIDVQDAIGIFARGTDYTLLKPQGHNIQPTVEEIIEKAKEFVEKYDKKIFLVTEDNSIFEEINNAFPNSIIYFPGDYHFDNIKPTKLLYRSIEKNKRIDVAKIYLTKILLLSRCKYFIGGKASGSLWACIFNDEKYEDCYLFEKGMY